MSWKQYGGEMRFLPKGVHQAGTSDCALACIATIARLSLTDVQALVPDEPPPWRDDVQRRALLLAGWESQLCSPVNILGHTYWPAPHYPMILSVPSLRLPGKLHAVVGIITAYRGRGLGVACSLSDAVAREIERGGGTPLGLELHDPVPPVGNSPRYDQDWLDENDGWPAILDVIYCRRNPD